VTAELSALALGGFWAYGADGRLVLPPAVRGDAVAAGVALFVELVPPDRRRALGGV